MRYLCGDNHIRFNPILAPIIHTIISGPCICTIPSSPIGKVVQDPFVGVILGSKEDQVFKGMRSTGVIEDFSCYTLIRKVSTIRNLAHHMMLTNSEVSISDRCPVIRDHNLKSRLL